MQACCVHGLVLGASATVRAMTQMHVISVIADVCGAAPG